MSIDWKKLVLTGDSPTFAGIVIDDGGTIGQASGPLLTFNDTDNYLGLTGCSLGIGIVAPEALLQIYDDGSTLSKKLLRIGKLNVGGYWDFSNAGNPTSRRALRAYFNTATPVVINFDPGAASYLNTGFNFGIGIAAPITRLDLANAANDDVYNEYIGFGAHNTAPNDSGGLIWKPRYSSYTKISAAIRAKCENNYFRLGLGFFTGNDADISTDAQERLRISASGNVGIGTIVPDTLLHIEKNTDSGVYGGYPTITFKNPNISGTAFAAMTFIGGTVSAIGVAGAIGQLYSVANNNVSQQFVIRSCASTYPFDLGCGSVTPIIRLVDGSVFIFDMRSGATQAAAGASNRELWKTSGHSSLPDNVVMIGV